MDVDHLSAESCIAVWICGPKLLWQLQLCSFNFNMAAWRQRWGCLWSWAKITKAEVNKSLFHSFCSQAQTWILTGVSWLIKKFKYHDCSRGRQKEEIDLKADVTREEENNIHWWFASIFQREGLQHVAQPDPRWRHYGENSEKWYKEAHSLDISWNCSFKPLSGGAVWWL